MNEKIKPKPSDIKANIYDNIKFIVDIEGVSNDGLDKSDVDISKLFNSKDYNRIEDNYTTDEINKWSQRVQRSITDVAKKRIIATEKVIRYISNDENEIVTISKYYVEIKLIYKKSHILRDKMQLLQNIIDAYRNKNEFFEFDNIILIKDNTIICKTLPMIYRCFNLKTYGDIRNGVKSKNVIFADYSISSNIVLEKSILNINKEIIAGNYKNSAAYMAKLNFAISYNENEEDKNLSIMDVYKDMNKSLFDIFINHLSKSFEDDLKKGETNKVLEGFHKNE